jgi:hypothetical protein
MSTRAGRLALVNNKPITSMGLLMSQEYNKPGSWPNEPSGN